ncbi:DUF4172 domain-containing protein [Chitinophaga parva]|uniref:DUF4172 domain-containing protein n=1 Tax=Chitinophaga parva TaxID=2169414 RepID=A0A2T7BKL5_9BACT|nr:Fic family protein [Chitinophaga parva]PUZ28171.1 DUF4172 domain-containing protein [Chitinophaga parva]
MTYNWQQADWPDFQYNVAKITTALQAFSSEIAEANGMLKSMPQSTRLQSIINTMVAEAIKTSAIEGELLNPRDVVSSVRNRLGLHDNPPIKDKRAKGIGELMVEVRNSYADPLSQQQLFTWHTLLLSQSNHIKTGQWRKGTEPMQVISGAAGRETIHYEAPPADKVPAEMKRYIQWFNDTAPGGRQEISAAPLRAAIAHLYFESIHPFEDGNGRIGRALAEKALSQTAGRPLVLSLSRTIEAARKDYYQALEKAQRSNEVTHWVVYFVNVVLNAQQQAKQLIEHTLQRSKFYDRFKDQLNERQLKAVNKMLDAGPEGFEGGITAKKYISITKASKATATRDLQDLAAIGALVLAGAGRSTHYTLCLDN